MPSTLMGRGAKGQERKRPRLGSSSRTGSLSPCSRPLAPVSSGLLGSCMLRYQRAGQSLFRVAVLVVLVRIRLAAKVASQRFIWQSLRTCQRRLQVPRWAQCSHHRWLLWIQANSRSNPLHDYLVNSDIEDGTSSDYVLERA